MSVSIRELITSILNEIKAAIKEYLNKQEPAVKKRLRKTLILSITGAVLLTIGISLAGSASLFILIGSLRYLQTFLPAWAAWYIIGATSALAAAVLFTALYLIIRKQLSDTKNTQAQH
jgi:uncharacterized BrkB/YihY/UPF0761 family membrane protein